MIALLLLWHKIFRTQSHNGVRSNRWYTRVCRDAVNIEAGIVDFSILLFRLWMERNRFRYMRKAKNYLAQTKAIAHNSATPVQIAAHQIILHTEQAFDTRTKYYYWFLIDISSSFSFQTSFLCAVYSALYARY